MFRRSTSRRTGVVVPAALAAASVLVPSGGAAAQAASASTPAIFHNASWYLRDSLSSGAATSVFRYGATGDVPVIGDWDGDGTDAPAVARFTETPDGFVYTWPDRGAVAHRCLGER